MENKQINEQIQSTIDNNNIVLFMKGTPDAPQCGFSMAVSNILKVSKVLLGRRTSGFKTLGRQSSLC